MFCCFKSCSRPKHVNTDNCCYLDSAVLRALITPDEELRDTIYVSYKNSFKDKEHIITPFAVICDKEYKSIVISLRGTADPSDVVIDALAEPSSIWEKLPESQQERFGESSYWRNFKGINLHGQSCTT